MITVEVYQIQNGKKLGEKKVSKEFKEHNELEDYRREIEQENEISIDPDTGKKNKIVNFIYREPWEHPFVTHKMKS